MDAGTTLEHAADASLKLDEAELTPVSALEKQLADAVAEMEKDQAAVTTTPVAASDVAISVITVASALGKTNAKSVHVCRCQQWATSDVSWRVY